MSAEDSNIEEAVDYEADEHPTTAADEVVEEMTAAGEEPAADSVSVEAAQKGADASKAEAGTDKANGITASRSTDPNDPMSLPPQGTEVFIGGIPKSATEEQIKAFCEQIGEVHSVKLNRDPDSGQNRGFGFARYFAKECAEAAKEKLHETELKDYGVKVRVSSTQPKNKLYLGNIPRTWNKDQLSDELNKNVGGKGLEKFDLVMSKDIPNQNRGYAFLIFYNHECAAAAKDTLSSPLFNMGGSTAVVSYAEPKPVAESTATAQASKAVYVGGLPSGATEEALKELFTKYGEVVRVAIPQATEKRPERQFGFVHFEAQASADKAVSEAGSDKPQLLGNSLEVKAARPQEQRAGFPNSIGPGGRGAGRASGSGRGPPFLPRGRGRGGRVPYSQTPGAYPSYDQGYDQGYGMYDQGMAGYDQGFGGYGAVPTAMAGASPAGMTMVPMMLPTGQVGYVLQSVDGGAADYGSYGGGGPERSYGQAHRGGRGGGGRGNSRYRPY